MMYSRDAYQMAENTPKVNHDGGCRSFGVGGLVTKLPEDRKCTCRVVAAAQRYWDKH